MDDGDMKKPYSDYRWKDNPFDRYPICNDCKHFHLKTSLPLTCDAFPDELPIDWAFLCKGERDLSVECANGIGFEPKEEQDG